MADNIVEEMSSSPAPTPGTGRSTFGRVVLLGLGAATLASVAGHQTWVSVGANDARAQALVDSTLTSGSDVGQSPAAGALALVCLATWGVLLVTRGRVRRVISGLGLLSALALLVAVVVDGTGLPDRVRSALGDSGDASVDVGHTAWFWVGAAAAVGCVVATGLAVRLVPAWPEMGTRYDAPTSGPKPEKPLEEQTNLDLWKSIDEGQDPTT